MIPSSSKPQQNDQELNLEAVSDEELIRYYLEEKDNRYFKPLYYKYSGKVYHKCLSILKEESLSRDAVQEIFMKVVLALSKFQVKSTFSTWLYSITYNYCIDQLRKAKNNVLSIEEDTAQISQIHDENSIQEADLLELKVEQLKLILAELGVADRMILLMKYQDDMSIRDIAEILGKSENAVKMMLKRSKERANKVYIKLFSNTGSD